MTERYEPPSVQPEDAQPDMETGGHDADEHGARPDVLDEIDATVAAISDEEIERRLHETLEREGYQPPAGPHQGSNPEG